MKTIGLLGGMSWESTLPYYRIINEAVSRRLGGLHSAKIILYSVDFHEIEQLQRTGAWTQTARLLSRAARSLELAGANMLVLCSNTMHKVAPEIERSIGIPVLHIADPTARSIRTRGLSTVGLLGTRFTMEGDFYRRRLESPHELAVLVPEASDQEVVHRIIYEELCVGVLRDDSRATFQQIICNLVVRGAQGVILGCTEISLLVGPDDAPVPLFDTTQIHAEAAAAWALNTTADR